jgi:hypothetical protein
MSDAGRRHLAKSVGFASKAALEAVASPIPVLGAILSRAITTLETDKLSHRIEALFADVTSLAAKVDRSKFDREYVESPDFEGIVLAALEAGRRSNDLHKRRWVAAVLVGAATNERPRDLDTEAILNTIGTLTSAELTLARLIYEGVDRTDFGIVQGVAPPAGFPDLDFHLKRVGAAGLIDGREPLTDFGPRALSYFPTDTFGRLVTLLKAGGWSLDKDP